MLMLLGFLALDFGFSEKLDNRLFSKRACSAY
jgi:hypothetical protein